MDTLLPAIFSLAGVLIGLLGAFILARQSLQGQRVLANDAARREWRMQQVAPYREAIDERVSFWLEMLNAMGGLDAKAIHALFGTPDFQSMTEEQQKTQASLEQQKNLQVVLDRLNDPKFNSLLSGLIAIPDVGVQAACQRFIAAEGELKTEYTSKEIGEIVMALRRAQANLNRAVEGYITSL
jgi:hypothetical protein